MVIPNWYQVTWWIGPLPVQVWGFFVAFGFLFALWLAVRRAPQEGVAAKDVIDAAVWIIVVAVIGARLAYVFEMFPYFADHLFEVIAIWEGGLSSYGGFAGALVAGVWFARRRGVSLARMSNLIATYLPLGWFVGRLGCYSIHDHAGIPCTGFFCVPFPDGTRRLDMGLVDGLATLAIWPVMLILARRAPPLRIGVLMVLYGFQRFVFDFLRVADTVSGTPKYSGLTFAQYLSIALLIAGAITLGRSMRARTTT